MRLPFLLVPAAPGLLAFASLLSACGPATPDPATSAATSAPASTAAPAPPATVSAVVAALQPGPPPKAECDAFMDVVARTTTLRASIHREPSTLARAEAWAAETARLADQARAIPLTQPDLIVESASLATRMSDLASELRALAAAEKSHDLQKMTEAHKRVLHVSEQVEVITREPAIRCSGDPKKLQVTAGRLAPAQIQSVVRASFGKFRLCYEAGLKRDATLQGRVTVRFVIGRDGKVAAVGEAGAAAAPGDDVAPPGEAGGTPMPDKQVVACIVDAFRALEFPKPDGGIVTVVYPIAFSPTQ